MASRPYARISGKIAKSTNYINLGTVFPGRYEDSFDVTPDKVFKESVVVTQLTTSNGVVIKAVANEKGYLRWCVDGDPEQPVYFSLRIDKERGSSQGQTKSGADDLPF